MELNGFDTASFGTVKTAAEAEAYVVGAKMGARFALALTQMTTDDEAIIIADSLFDRAYEKGGWENADT